MELLTDKGLKLENLIPQISPGLLRSYVFQAALEDETLYHELLTCFSPDISQQEIKHLGREVDKIFYSFTDISPQISNDDIPRLCKELNLFLNRKIKFLVGNHHYKHAFFLTNYIFRKLDKQPMEDIYGISSQVANNCYQCWKLIFLNIPAGEDRKALHQWFVDHLHDYSLDFMSGYLYDFLLFELHDRKMILKHLKLLDEIIEANEKVGTDCGVISSSYYGSQNVLMQRINCMKMLGMSELDIYEYRRIFWHFSTIRQMAINEYVSHNNLMQAIEVLKESKERDFTYPKLLSVYSSNLIRIYDSLHMNSQQKKELFYHLSSFPQENTEYFLKLKKLCSAVEWTQLREELFLNLPKGTVLYDIFVEEGLTDRLLQCLREDGKPELLSRYGAALQIQHSRELLELYGYVLVQLVEHTCTKKDYQSIISNFTAIAAIPEGSSFLKNLISQWRERYSGKRMLQQELQKYPLI